LNNDYYTYEQYVNYFMRVNENVFESGYFDFGSENKLLRDYYTTSYKREEGTQEIEDLFDYFTEVLGQLAAMIFKEYDKVKIDDFKEESEALDLSDTSAVEKIIYLNELGIIDFLKTKPEFIGSTNLMATFLSAITAVKASTLQTSLNRLINEDTTDKNHPYRTTKTVSKVRQTLIDKNIKPKTS